MSDKRFRKADLYVYDLSPSVLSSLDLIVFDDTLREVSLEPDTNAESSKKDTAKSRKEQPLVAVNHCNVCDVDFSNQESKRQHYKMNFHTFNVKRHLNGLPPVDGDEFTRLLKNLNNEEKIQDTSDSDDNDSDNDESSESRGKSEETNLEIYNKQDDYLGSLIEEELGQLSIDGAADENVTSSLSHLNTRSANIFFNSDLVQNSEAFSLYKSLFSKETIKNPLLTIRQWNELDDQSMEISALFMIGGGHFSGAIVSHQRANVGKNLKKGEENLQEQTVMFLEHKTFHRYTTRRKQGGSQSAMDQAKGKANSAGSSLRRYNETALKMDVQNILKEWEPYLGKCQNIFLRAHNAAERRVFTENSSISRSGEKLKGYPFTTGRPTINELKRCWCELTYLKKSTKPAPLPLKRTVPSGNGIATNPAQDPKCEVSTKSPEELHTEAILSLLKRGRAPLLVAYLRKNKLSPDFRLMPQKQYQLTPTMLHYSAQHGLKQMIIILITNIKCDPCIENQAGKTAWDLAKEVPIQQSFQIARYNMGESFKSWDEAHIGPPLSREEVEEMKRQEEDRQKDAIEAAMKLELENAKTKQKREEAKKVPGRTLEESSVRSLQNMNSMTDEQRRRLMREQRARAAEARMQKS